MGKIHIDFHVSYAANLIGAPNGSKRGDGISTKNLVETLNAIPGDTYVEKIEEQQVVSLARTWRVFANNDWFEDGTEIDSEWVRCCSVDSSGQLQQFNLFKGLVIHQPGKPPMGMMVPAPMSAPRIPAPSPSTPITPLVANPTASNLCNHSWKTYNGFTEKYDYCTVCGAKK